MTYELYHHGILGQKWGVRRFQNTDGTLTEAGRKRNGLKEGPYESNKRLNENILKRSGVSKDGYSKQKKPGKVKYSNKNKHDASYDFRKAAKLGILAAMCGLYAYQKMKDVKVSDIKPPTTPPVTPTVETIFDINKELGRLAVRQYVQKYGVSENIHLDAELAKLYMDNRRY